MGTRVADVPEESLFVVYDGDERAGVAQYHRSRAGIAFTHTEIDPEFEGRGLGGILARGALDAARERGEAVLPYCPFIRGWIARHPDYLDLVPEARRAQFQL